LPPARLSRDALSIRLFVRAFAFFPETLLPAGFEPEPFFLAFKGSFELTRRNNCFTRLSETPNNLAVSSTVGYRPLRVIGFGFMHASSLNLTSLQAYVPPGARKGGFGLGAAPGPAIFRRLREHARSIEETPNLRIKHFSGRYLISDDIWIPLGEALLIAQFQPLWNVLIAGFGIHKPGKNRPQQLSKWDTLHSGRKLASGLPSGHLQDSQLTKMVADFFAGKAVKLISPGEAVVEEE
jgi:hypothetical protein